MNCKNCGAPHDINLSSCPYCGTPYSRAEGIVRMEQLCAMLQELRFEATQKERNAAIINALRI